MAMGRKVRIMNRGDEPAGMVVQTMAKLVTIFSDERAKWNANLVALGVGFDGLFARRLRQIELKAARTKEALTAEQKKNKPKS